MEFKSIKIGHSSCLLVLIILMTSNGVNPIPKYDGPNVWASPKIPTNAEDYRLPKDVIPVSYEMFFIPDLEDKFIFNGTSKIVIDVITETRRIVLHARDLTIKKTTLTGPNGDLIPARPAPLNTINDFLVINLGAELVPNTKYTLELIFVGVLNTDDKGFFRIQYEAFDGKFRWAAMTHFSPTSARSAFPCWDEPHLKATFDISIKHHESLHAISNMHGIATRVDKTESHLNYFVTTFDTTPKMSTYLVAFIVSDYETLSNSERSVNIWAERSTIRRCGIILEITEKVLEAFDTYTGISYASHGFNKMDVVVILPSQRDISAMENWGVITLDESLLITGQNISTSTNARRTEIILSHELTHQWFGNLVSPKSWRYLWLKEGFGIYFQYVMTDKILPEWRLKERQVVEGLQRYALTADSGRNAKALNQDVYSPSEIYDKFTEISYYKAGSVMRTIAHVLGEAKFQIALKKYLNKMKFQAATSDDLFEEFVKEFPTLTDLTAKPIDILNNWADTPGFPVITVTRNYDKNTTDITQERFLNERGPADTQRYYVPINYATQGEKDFDNTTVTSWLDKRKPITEIKGNFKKNEWIIFNKQQFGYYRVNYDKENWALIADFLKSANYKDIHVINRAQLVDDALNLAKIGKLEYNVALDVLQFLEQELDPIPWYPAVTGLSHLGTVLVGTGFYEKFQKYVLKLVRNVFRNVTWRESLEDDDLRKELRFRVVELACNMGSKACKSKAYRKVIRFLNHPRQIIPWTVMNNIILCAGIRHVDQETWDELYEKVTSEGTDFLAAFGCTSNKSILKGYLLEVMNPFRRADSIDSILQSVIDHSREGVNVMLDFINENPMLFYGLFDKSRNKLSKYIERLCSKITTTAQLEKLEFMSNGNVKFITNRHIKAAQASLNSWTPRATEFEEFLNRLFPDTDA